MNTLLVICALAIVSSCVAVNNYAYSGNASQYFATTALPVVITANTGACAPGATATGYNKFTVNVTAPAASYYVSLMTERASKGNMQVNVYGGAGFVPATPCVNLVQSVPSDSGTSVPHLNGIVWLAPGTYTFVVTTETVEPTALFVVHVDRVPMGNISSSAGPFWTVPTTSTPADLTCGTTGSVYSYISYTWMQTTSGVMDLYGAAYNATAGTVGPFTATFALYNNTPSFIGNMTTVAAPADPCTGFTSIFMGAWSTGSNNVGAWRGVNLTAGTNYTIVMGSYDSTAVTGYLSFWMAPTAVGYMGTMTNFLRPSLAVYYPDTCAAGTSTYTWQVVPFTTRNNVYIIDNPYGTFDTAGCLYRGLNLGSADYVTPPASCPIGWIGCSDTGDIAPLVASGIPSGTNFTYVQTAYSSSSVVGQQFVVFIYTGTPLPGTVISGVVTGATSTGATGEMSHSGASSVAYAVMLVLAMIILA